MKVIWALLCERSVIDKETNNLSVHNVIEELTVISTPPQGPPVPTGPGEGIAMGFQLVALWTRSLEEVPERGNGRVRLVLPGDESQLGAEYEVDLTQYLRLRYLMHIAGLPMRGEGTYRFVIEGKDEDGQWTPMFEVPLRVIVKTEET